MPTTDPKTCCSPEIVPKIDKGNSIFPFSSLGGTPTKTCLPAIDVKYT
nr:hypothetical protein [Mycoplasmopsis bovis]